MCSNGLQCRQPWLALLYSMGSLLHPLLCGSSMLLWGIALGNPFPSQHQHPQIFSITIQTSCKVLNPYHMIKTPPFTTHLNLRETKLRRCNNTHCSVFVVGWVFRAREPLGLHQVLGGLCSTEGEQMWYDCLRLGQESGLWFLQQ